jgi:hypothetical protein
MPDRLYPHFNPYQMSAQHWSQNLPGGQNPFAQMGYDAISSRIMPANFTPMAFGGQSMIDQARHQNFMAQHQEVLQRAWQNDRENAMRFAQGGARAIGAQFGDAERAHMNSMLDPIGPVASMAAVNTPRGMDFISGLRGSQTVMASHMLMGSRFRFDPVTGQYGMSTGSATAMVDSSAARFNKDDVSAWRGYSAGNVGEMSQFMLSRGILGGTSAADRTREGMRELLAAEPEGNLRRRMAGMDLDPDRDLDRMSSTQMRELMSDRDIQSDLRETPAAANRMRSFNAEKVLENVQKYTQAVSAIGDLFNDTQKGIPQLMKKLEELVGPNAMFQMDPEQLGRSVGALVEGAKMSGTSAGQLQQHMYDASNMAAKFGLTDPGSAMAIAQQRMAASMATEGRPNVYGGLTRRQMGVSKAALMGNAMRSADVNVMNALIRRADSSGPFNSDELNEYVEMGRAGITPDKILEHSDAAAILDKSGDMTEGEWSYQTQNYADNTRTGIKYGTQDIGLRWQRKKAQDVYATRSAAMLRGTLGFDPERATMLAAGVQDRFFAMGDNGTDTVKRRAVAEKYLRENMSEDELDRASPLRVAQNIQNVINDERVSMDASGSRNANQTFQKMNVDAMDKEANLRLQFRVNHMLADQFNSMANIGVERGAVEALMTSTGDLGDWAKKSLGITDTKKRDMIAKGLLPARDELQELGRLKEKFSRANSKGEKDSIISDIEAQQELVDKAINTAAGAFKAAAVDPEKLAKDQEAIRTRKHKKEMDKRDAEDPGKNREGDINTATDVGGESGKQTIEVSVKDITGTLNCVDFPAMVVDAKPGDVGDVAPGK